MGESITIDFHAPCTVCDRKIGPVQPWVPHGQVIVHSRCHVDAFHDFCSERDLLVSDESYRAFCMWLDEDVNAPGYFAEGTDTSEEPF